MCAILDEVRPNDPVVPHRKLIAYVKDRPGHDRRYAIDARKIERELGWCPRETFEAGIRKTVLWYLKNEQWVRDVTSGAYREWTEARRFEPSKCGDLCSRVSSGSGEYRGGSVKKYKGIVLAGGLGHAALPGYPRSL